MRWSLVLASAGIATLGVACFAIIGAASRVTADQRTTTEATPPTAVAPMASGPARVGVPGQNPNVPDPPPPTDLWDAVVPVERGDEMGAVGPAFAAALSASFGELGRCFEEDSAARYAAGAAVTATKGEKQGPSVLLLEFETMAGVARIVDAPVGIRGTAGDGVILCAQGVFRGMRIDVPGVLPGKRYRMRYALVQ